nr:hypothetical protein [Tanacetum cinerariifolium]
MGKRKLSDYDDNESDDDICVNSRTSKISCYEKGCYSDKNGGDYVNVESGYSDDDEAAAEDKVDSVSFVKKFSCDKVDGVEEERMDEKRRGYVNDDSTHYDHKECCSQKSCKVNGELSENKGRYWDTWSESAENGGDYVNVKSGYSDDDEAAAEDKVDSVSFVEKFSCNKVDGVEEERMDEKRRGYVNDDSTDDDHEGFFVKEESCGSCEEKGGNVARDEIVDEECCYEKSFNVNGELGENKGRYWDT